MNLSLNVHAILHAEVLLRIRAAMWSGVLLLSILWSASIASQTTDADATTAAADEERYQLLAQELAERQALLADMQSDQGVYGASLVEAHSDLGALYSELGDPEGALRSYGEALQLARINNGLHSSQQLAIIDSMIAVHRDQADWAEVDDLEHLSFHVSSRLHERSDPAYFEAASRFGEWRLRLIRQNLMGLSTNSRMNTAEDLSAFYATILDEATQTQDPEASDLARLLYGKTRADVAVAQVVAGTPYAAFQGTVSRYVTQTRCRNVATPQGGVARECYQVQVENPRYRQSQREAKRFALMRYNRQINESLEQMRGIRDTGSNISADERQQLDNRIAELEIATQEINRSGRRNFPF